MVTCALVLELFSIVASSSWWTLQVHQWACILLNILVSMWVESCCKLSHREFKKFSGWYVKTFYIVQSSISGSGIWLSAGIFCGLKSFFTDVLIEKAVRLINSGTVFVKCIHKHEVTVLLAITTWNFQFWAFQFKKNRNPKKFAKSIQIWCYSCFVFVFLLSVYYSLVLSSISFIQHIFLFRLCFILYVLMCALLLLLLLPTNSHK